MALNEEKFINQTTYWGEAGYGALFGKRSATQKVIIEKLVNGPLNNGHRLTFVATGAGVADRPQGGGFIIHPTIGLDNKSTIDCFMIERIRILIMGIFLAQALFLSMNTWKLTEGQMKHQLIC